MRMRDNGFCWTVQQGGYLPAVTQLQPYSTKPKLRAIQRPWIAA